MQVIHPSLRILFAAVVVAVSSAPVFATDIFWNDDAGGLFSINSNWLGGISPDAPDNAIFDMGSTGYTVTFDADVTNNQAVVRNDIVTFDLSGHTYTLFDFVSDPHLENLVVGQGAGSGGFLTLINGTASVHVTEVGQYFNLSPGAGTLTVSTGATLNGSILAVQSKGSVVVNGGGVVNQSSSTFTGNMIVTGAGSSFSSGNFQIGASSGDFATIDVLDGGNVTGTNIAMGRVLTSVSGAVNVEGPGSTLTDTAELRVGDFGIGVLSVTNSGTVSSNMGSVGKNAGSHGTATVGGAGSNWIMTQSLNVGEYGDGTMAISNGGTVSSNTVVNIGTYTGATGAMTVKDNGSTLHTNTLNVGTEGSGILNILNGGQVTSNSGYIGQFAGSQGTVNLDGVGSDWTINSGFLYVGRIGDGSLSVTDGATLHADEIVVANNAANSGDVTVSGNGATLITNGAFLLGNQGVGSLTINTGGAVVTGGDAVVANLPGSSAMASVDGLGSSWSTGRLDVRFGGTLDVTGGATITSSQAYTNGTASISGPGSAWNSNGGLSVAGALGTGTTGSLTVSGGGGATSTQVQVGGGAGPSLESNGLLIIDGPGSNITSSGELAMSSLGGVGTVNINNGGALNTGIASVYGASFIGDSLNGGIATMTVSGAGSSWNSSDYISVQSGSTMNVVAGGMIASTGAVLNYGTVALDDGGTITANVRNNGGNINASGAGTQTINGDVINNGTIKTTDTTLQITGTFTNNGKFISDPSVNIFADLIVGADGYFVGGMGERFIVNGDFTNNSEQASLWDTGLATLIFDVTGIHNFILASDDFGVDGIVDNFNWGTLRLESGASLNLFDDIEDGAALYVGLLDLADGVDQLSLINSAYNIYYDESLAGNSYLNGQTISLAGGAVLTPGTFTSAVPVPAAVWLLGSGLIGLIGIARRKKA